MQFLLQLQPLVACLLNQFFPCIGIGMIELSEQFAAKLVLQGVTGRAGALECIERQVIPLEQALLCSSFDVRHVQLNDFALTNAVEATDTLLQQVRVCRQVKHDQVVSKLEITALTADFRADHDLCAKFFIGEERSGAVAFDDAHALMENGCRYAAAHAQSVFQIQCGFGVCADHQHLAAFKYLEGVDKPLDTGIFQPPHGFSGIKISLQGLLRI